jgi:hypothetical protein
MELAAYEGNGPPLPNKNVARKILWGTPVRTLTLVLDHITAGNNPWLTYLQMLRCWKP